MARSPMMMVGSLAILYISRKYVDPEIPMHLFVVRAIYMLVQLLCFSVVTYLYVQAKNNKDPGMVTVKEDMGFGQEEGQDVKISISEHDSRECMNQYQRMGMGFLITCCMHAKWGFLPPLLIQSLVHPVSLWNTQLVKVCLRSQRSWGELKRPWIDPTKKMAANWRSVSETWTAAMNGTPVIKRNASKADKKSSKKKKRN